MFVLFWATLLFSVGGNNAARGSVPGGKEHCQEQNYCITLSEAEITAEAGLCAVLHCSFTTATDFYANGAIWYKCDSARGKCPATDKTIFNSNDNKNVQSGFKGRVSLLDPELSHKNCSIIINDLKESDSGSYQLRVTGTKYWRSDGFMFRYKATIKVKDLSQKPTLMIPTLKAGQQTTLTCTAPGLCSGSDPKITWTWRGAGEKDSHITGNITANQGQISTLTFNVSAEHHGSEVTCKVSFTGNRTTEEMATLNVTFFPRILSSSACEVQSEVLTCVCVSGGFPLPTIKWPILENYDKFSVITTVSHHTVNSTLILTVKEQSNTVVECVSGNGNGEVQQNLSVMTSERREVHKDFSKQTSQIPTISCLITSLVANVSFIIYFVFLWNSRKKVKPNEEDLTYMSLQKTDGSPEYDVIGQRLN